MASITHHDETDRSAAPNAAVGYLLIAETYERMARAAEEAGNPVRAANKRRAAAAYRTLGERRST